MKYRAYYVADENRLEAMLVCSLNHRINWCEDGLKLVSWRYNLVDEGDAGDINEVFRKKTALQIDHRRKKQIRSMSLGDIIVFDEVPWIVGAFGFFRIPDILFEQVPFC